MKTYGFVNQKGGAGKTTVALFTAAAAVKQGRRILVVDLDPQATISDAACGYQASAHLDDTGTIAAALKHPDRIPFTSCIRHADNYGFDVALGHLDVRDLERSFQIGDQWILRDKLAEVAGDYDLCIIDAPPLLGFGNTLIFFAADRLVVVADPRWAGTRAASKLADELDRAQRNGAKFDRAGVIINFVERTVSVAAGIAEFEASDRFGPVWDVKIPKGTVLDDAIGAGARLDEFGMTKRAYTFATLFDRIAEVL